MAHKTAVVARCWRPGRVRGTQLALLASAGSGVGTRRGAARSTSRARALGRATNSVASGLTGESRFPRGLCAQACFEGQISSAITRHTCRVNSCVSHSKQTTVVHITRHTNEGGRGTEFSPHLGGATLKSLNDYRLGLGNSDAAAIKQAAITTEEAIGAMKKYVQLKTITATKQMASAHAGPRMRASISGGNPPSCHDRTAANKRNTVTKNPKPEKKSQYVRLKP
jgi:hypothetical protein